MIVLHYTGMADAEAALELLKARGSEVSAHYFVFEDGRIIQMVQESPPRLACRQGPLGRRDRHQFLLDRN